jgi:hypothetical protein
LTSSTSASAETTPQPRRPGARADRRRTRDCRAPARMGW